MQKALGIPEPRGNIIQHTIQHATKLVTFNGVLVVEGDGIGLRCFVGLPHVYTIFWYDLRVLPL